MKRHLLDAIDRYWRRQPGDLQQGRDDVNNVVVLRSELASTFDLPRPRDNQRIGVAALMRILLPPLQWRIAGPSPSPWDRADWYQGRRACRAVPTSNGYNTFAVGKWHLTPYTAYTAAGPFDLLFTDIQMPGSLDGLTLAHAVHERWPPIKIILVSGQLKRANINIPADSRFFGKPLGTFRTWRDVRLESVIGSTAEDICSI